MSHLPLRLFAVLLAVAALSCEDLAPAPDASAAAAEELMRQLPRVPAVVVRDGRVWWQADERSSCAVVAIEPQSRNPVLETRDGRVQVQRRLVEEGRTEALSALQRLLATAREGGLSGEFLLTEGILTGYHLWHPVADPKAKVLAEGVVRLDPAPSASRAEERTALAEAVAALKADLASSPVGELGRKAIADVLDRVPRDEGEPAADEVAPSLARRLVRSGWLQPFFPRSGADEKLKEAVHRAERFLPTRLYTGRSADGRPLRLADVADAFGRQGWTLQTPQRSAFARLHPEPFYHWAFPELRTVVELPPGCDPAAPLAGDPQHAPVAARLFRDSQAIAAWTSAKGLSVDAGQWRQAVPGRGRRGVDKNAVTDFIPPHILVSGLDGDPWGIAVEGGLLLAPRSGTAQEGERFIADCARLLPDPARLDLVGEYLLSYVYDSPEPGSPMLIGNKGNKGDIHQTALQTLSTAAGGQVRGDCDDLSELYQAIAERQGRTAHVVSLPQHAACAWAERREDGLWHVYVLQTGPALEFTDAKLQIALERAYKSFDDSETFDPNGLGLLLRFTGENTRGSWRLSYRIFSEPEYARVMIDVQKDWHFQTYQRGIAKMLKLIAGGDNDTANYRELSGLYSFTGQHGLAAEFHAKAIERTEEPASRLYMQVELLGHLFEAKQDDQAKALAGEILARHLPALRDKLGASAIQFGLQLTGMLAGHQADDLALRAAKDTLQGFFPPLTDRLARWLSGPEFNSRAWENAPQLQSQRRLLQEFAGVATSLTERSAGERLAQDATAQAMARAVQTWLDAIAFRDLDEPGEVLFRYAAAARLYSALLGEEALMAQIERAQEPKDGRRDHARRLGGLPQLAVDAPWIRISVPFWWGRLTERLGKDAEKIDAAEIRRLGERLAAAHAATSRLGLDLPQYQSQAHLGRLVVALVAQDEAGLRACLKHVVRQNDKRLRDDTAQWLGDPARHLPIEWYRTVLRCWKEEINYKPKWFWIAWRAALSKAPKHALLAAELAAKEFKDDAAFLEEYEFMKKLLDK